MAGILNNYTTSFSALEKPHKKRRISRKAFEQELREQLEREARQREDDESRNCAVEYLQDFVESSEWSDRMDYISIVWDAVPTMDELFSYGLLDSTEGTKACRRMFKAVVIWDELGRALWEQLNTAAPEDDESSVVTLSAAQAAPLPSSASCMSRRASEDSSISRLSFWTAVSRTSSTGSSKKKWYSRPRSSSKKQQQQREQQQQQEKREQQFLSQQAIMPSSATFPSSSAASCYSTSAASYYSSTSYYTSASVSASTYSGGLCECCSARLHNSQPQQAGLQQTLSADLGIVAEEGGAETPRSGASTTTTTTTRTPIASALRRTWTKLSERSLSHARLHL